MSAHPQPPFDPRNGFRLSGESGRSFLTSGTTFGAVYALAERLREALGTRDTGRNVVCLASEDRALTAAAVLSSLSGGPRLVIPHSLSESVLEEAREAISFDLVVSEQELTVPKGITLARFSAGEGESSGPPNLSRRADEPFLSLFTGGSTGRPKAWTKTAANLLGEAAYLADRFGFGVEDVFVSTVPVNHIYGLLFSLLAPLLAGSRVMAGRVYLPAEVVRALDDSGCTVLVSGPAHYRALRRADLVAPRLRLAFSSGGMLDGEDGARFEAQTGKGVTEVYGSTETGGVATRCRAEGEVDWTPFEPVRWEVGNEQLMVDSPFVSPELKPGIGGTFATGDRACATEEGRFALLGRVDGIVKVAGERVDLLEVEQKIRSLSGVADAHVLAEPVDTARSNELVALVVYPGSVDELRERVAEKLEPFAMPRRFVVVDRIPTTAVGKRDTRVIAALLRAAPDKQA